MRTASLAVAAQQDRVRRFEKQHFGSDGPFYRLDDGGQFFELTAFADVHYQRGTLNFRRLARQFGKTGDKSNREVVHAVIAKIFEGFQDGSFAGTAHSGDDD